MALDTAAKRASAINPRLPWRTLPFPDGTVAAGDRQHLVWLYSGILAGEQEPEPEPEPEPVVETVSLPAGASGGFRGRGERGITARYPGAPRKREEPRYVEELLTQPPEPGEPASVAAAALAGVLDEHDRKRRQARRNKQITGLLLQLIALED